MPRAEKTAKIKACPFCGGENAMFIRSKSGLGMWVLCNNCAAIGPTCQTKEKAIEAWNRRYEPPNEPLTLEELRQMDGEPVWCVDGLGNQCWCLVNCDDGLPCCYDNETGLWEGSFYDTTGDREYGLHQNGWRAYRRRPEEEIT